MKYWETIAAKIRASGWSLKTATVHVPGKGLFHVVGAQRDGMKHIAQAEEITTAFLEVLRGIEILLVDD